MKAVNVSLQLGFIQVAVFVQAHSINMASEFLRAELKEKIFCSQKHEHKVHRP